MSEGLVEEGVPPEELRQAEDGGAEGPRALESVVADVPQPDVDSVAVNKEDGSFHELCTRLGIADVEENLAAELNISSEQELLVLAELGLPEIDCRDIGIDSSQRKAILEWAKQENQRKRDEQLSGVATRQPIHTPEELAETEQIERKARAGRSLAASGFPWVDTHGEVQHKVTLWSYLYKEEAARIDPRKGASKDQESAPEPEPEPEPKSCGDGTAESGMRSWEAPNNAAMDEALAAAEAKKLADDLEPAALDQAAALMAARSGRAAPVPADGTGNAEEPLASAALYGAPQEPEAAKGPGALDPAEIVATEGTGADSTSLAVANGPNSDGAMLQRAPSHVPSGRFGEGDWFCDARLRRCTASKESWAEFRKLVPAKMKAVQPLIEAWLVRKAEAKQAAASKHGVVPQPDSPPAVCTSLFTERLLRFPCPCRGGAGKECRSGRMASRGRYQRKG